MENEILNKDKIYINGPTNFFKLNNGNKTIYLFFDVHENIIYQQECENIYSINIDKYLKHVFKNTDKKIDYMLETPDLLQNNSNNDYLNDKNHNHIYIQKLRKLYIDEKNIQINVRFHYIDIRFNSPLITIIDLFNMCESELNYNKLHNLYKIINNLLTILSTYDEILKIIDKYKNKTEYDTNTENKNENETENETNKWITYVIRKILTKYDDINIQKKIVDFFDKFVINKIIYLKNSINEKIEYYKKLDLQIYQNYSNLISEVEIVGENDGKTIYFHSNTSSKDYNKYFNEIKNNIKYFNSLSMDINVFIMDSYFLRRFLDKNYINNVILYAGSTHATTYLWFLIKYCNFKINEYEYIGNNLSPSEFEKIIKKSDDMYNIFSYINPVNFKQCISLKPITF